MENLYKPCNKTRLPMRDKKTDLHEITGNIISRIESALDSISHLPEDLYLPIRDTVTAIRECYDTGNLDGIRVLTTSLHNSLTPELLAYMDKNPKSMPLIFALAYGKLNFLPPKRY